MAEELFDKEFLRKLEYLDLIARRLVFGRQQALRPSVKKGASIEFKDYREYTPGDDPRTVDWSIYARLNELVIKLFRQEEELDLWVLLDRSGVDGLRHAGTSSTTPGGWPRRSHTSACPTWTPPASCQSTPSSAMDAHTCAAAGESSSCSTS